MTAKRKRQLKRIKSAVNLLEGYLLELKKQGWSITDTNPAFRALYQVAALARKARS
jgi:hypothetical protein